MTYHVRSAHLLLVVAAAIAAIPAFAERIAIIGTGDVATAIGPRFAAAGHRIVYGSRTPEAERVVALVRRTGNGASASPPADAASEAEFIVMAVPAEVAVEVIIGLGDIAGKIVIDPTNAFEITEDRLAVRTSDVSMGELLQAAAPDARIVKALNSVGYRTMHNPQRAGGAVTIPIAGNDEGAKRLVSGLLGQLGFDSVDAGPIRYARELEGMLLVWMNARLGGSPFNYYFRPEQVRD